MPKSPQSNEIDSVLMSRRSQWGFVSAFLLFLVWPWIVELVSPGEATPPNQTSGLLDRLKGLEGRVKDLSFFVNERPADQGFMEKVFREGNAKVFIGEDGWLYYRPDLEAVFGKGPFYQEPASVAREKVADRWNPPLEVIGDFAAQLQDRGIKLVIVPVPTKPMLSRSGLGIEDEPEVRGHYEVVLANLAERGISTVDVLPVIESLPESSRFLRHDTHWTPSAMELAAESVAEALVEIGDLKRGDLEIEATSLKKMHFGDLAGMLDRSEIAGDEVELSIPRGAVTDDGESSVVLLGDSFVNIYDEPGLGFSDESAQRLGAGFAAHLSANLKDSIQTIAINGDGATAVRREFASLPDHVIRSKKVVVWVLSSRDLLLAELPARRAGIRWMPVKFREGQVESTEMAKLTISATVAEVSHFTDPRETAYKDAVYSLLLSDLDVETGSYRGEEMFAFAWAFKDRVLQESSRLEVGKRYRFTLVPFKEAEAVSNATQVDDLFRTDLDPRFISEFETLP